jgi:hypothetical protein
VFVDELLASVLIPIIQEACRLLGRSGALGAVQAALVCTLIFSHPPSHFVTHYTFDWQGPAGFGKESSDSAGSRQPFPSTPVDIGMDQSEGLILWVENWLTDFGIFDPPVVFGVLLFFTRVGFSAGVGLPTSCNHFERWSSAETCH